MSMSRKIRRAGKRQNFGLDLLEASGPLPQVQRVTLALAGTGSGARRRAAKIAKQRAAKYFEMTGKKVEVTPGKVCELAVQLAKQAREAEKSLAEIESGLKSREEP